MLRSPHMSARWLSLALRLKKCSVRRIVHKDLHYQIKSNLLRNLVNGTKWADLFCNALLDLVKNNSGIVNTLLMSDEAHFHVSGYMNKQKYRYWAPNNRHELHHCPLHSAKSDSVVCSLLLWHYWSLFLWDWGGMYSKRYKVMSEIFLRIELHPRQQDLLWPQQDGATAQTAEISMQVLRTRFPGRLNSR